MNPKMPLILLVSFLSTFAACSKESAPRPSDTAPPAQATSPAQAPSPTPLPAASTPPPPAGPVLQSQDTNTAGIFFGLHRVQAQGRRSEHQGSVSECVFSGKVLQYHLGPELRPLLCDRCQQEVL